MTKYRIMNQTTPAEPSPPGRILQRDLDALEVSHAVAARKLRLNTLEIEALLLVNCRSRKPWPNASRRLLVVGLNSGSSCKRSLNITQRPHLEVVCVMVRAANRWVC
jgi:hypothetical protein